MSIIESDCVNWRIWVRSKKWSFFGTPLPAILFAKSVSGGPFLVLFADLCGRTEIGRTLTPGGPEERNRRFAQKIFLDACSARSCVGISSRSVTLLPRAQRSGIRIRKLFPIFLTISEDDDCLLNSARIHPDTWIWWIYPISKHEKFDKIKVAIFFLGANPFRCKQLYMNYMNQAGHLELE